MSYRGPNSQRISGQFAVITQYHGEVCTWRQYVSAVTAAGSGYYGGGGVTLYYREQMITGLWAAPQMGESRFRETQLPGGQVIAGDAVVSVPVALAPMDEIIWRGVTYRLEGDNTPVVLGGRTWYRHIVRRGDTTG
jgi:hypothetical protein